MKKILLGVALTLASLDASASGLYISGGYMGNAPTYKEKGLASDKIGQQTSPGVYAPIDDMYSSFANDLFKVQGWPTWTDKLYNPKQYDAASWLDTVNNGGMKQTKLFSSKKGDLYSVALGYDVANNPLRFEAEYLRLETGFDTMSLTVYPRDGFAHNYEKNPAYEAYLTELATYQTEHASWAAEPADSRGAEPVAPTPVDEYIERIETVSKYEFTLSGKDDENLIDASSDIYMGNVYFEIPGFGDLDPYIGYGKGKAKVKYKTYIDTFSYDADAEQYIGGVEVKMGDSPYILGLEYRRLTLNMKYTGSEYDLGVCRGNELKDSSIMFKLRYDFPPDSPWG